VEASDGTTTTAEPSEQDGDPDGPDDGNGDDYSDAPEGTLTELQDLTVGMCFQDPQADVLTEVSVIDCDERHDFEVYHVGDLEEGPWLGADAVRLPAY
jgi:hypothetical protein